MSQQRHLCETPTDIEEIVSVLEGTAQVSEPKEFRLGYHALGTLHV